MIALHRSGVQTQFDVGEKEVAVVQATAVFVGSNAFVGSGDAVIGHTYSAQFRYSRFESCEVLFPSIRRKPVLENPTGSMNMWLPPVPFRSSRNLRHIFSPFSPFFNTAIKLVEGRLSLRPTQLFGRSDALVPPKLVAGESSACSSRAGSCVPIWV